MTRAKRRPPAGDAVIRGCLDRLRRGHVDGAAVLADRLDDESHRLARQVRAVYVRWHSAVKSYLDRAWPPRRGLAVWEETGLWHRYLRDRIGKLFGRAWDPLSLEEIARKNPSLTTPVDLREGDAHRSEAEKQKQERRL